MALDLGGGPSASQQCCTISSITFLLSLDECRKASFPFLQDLFPAPLGWWPCYYFTSKTEAMRRDLVHVPTCLLVGPQALLSLQLLRVICPYPVRGHPLLMHWISFFLLLQGSSFCPTVCPSLLSHFLSFFFRFCLFEREKESRSTSRGAQRQREK